MKHYTEHIFRLLIPCILIVLVLACSFAAGFAESMETDETDAFLEETADLPEYEEQLSDVTVELLMDGTDEGNPHAHEGGTADCTHLACCAICQEEYGDFGPHSWSEGVCTNCLLQAVAVNGAGEHFEVFAAAWEYAISSGERILLCADVVSDIAPELPSDASVNLDLGGHSLTFASDVSFQGFFGATNGSVNFERLYAYELSLTDCSLTAQYIYAQGNISGNADITVATDFFSTADITCRKIVVNETLETFESIYCDEINAYLVGAGKNIECTGSIVAPLDVNVVSNLTCFSVTTEALGVGEEFRCKGDVVATSTATFGGAAICGNLYAGEAINAADSIVCTNLETIDLITYGNLLCDSITISGESTIGGDLVCKLFTNAGTATIKDSVLQCDELQNSGSITLTRMSADCVRVNNSGTFIVNSTVFQAGNTLFNGETGQLKLAGLDVIPCVLNQGAISIYTRPELEPGSFICLYMDVGCLETVSVPITRLTAENAGYFSVCSNGRMIASSLERNGVLSARAEHGWNPETGSCPFCNMVCEHVFEGDSCSICGHSHAPQILAEKEPGCVETGLSEGSICALCGQVLCAQEEIPALGHVSAVILSVAPSCVSTGATEGERCSVCGTVLAEPLPIDALGHTEEILAGTASSCTAAGLTEGKRCSVCNEILVPQTFLPLAEHDLVPVPGFPADCENTGLTEGEKCAVCGKIFKPQFTVEALGHVIVSIPVIMPSCTEKGLSEGEVCSVCGKVIKPQEELQMLPHVAVTVPGKAPTCLAPGLAEGEVCGVCGIELKAQEQLPALGHFDADKNGVCDACGVYIESEIFTVSFHMNGHGAEIEPQTIGCGDTVQEPARPYSDGYIFSGWYLDDSLSIRYDFSIVPTGDLELYAKWVPASPVPRTGDEMDAAPWVLLILISAIILVITLMSRPKKKKHK